MEKQLSLEEERLMWRFGHELDWVVSVEDMFPPDNSGDLEPRQPVEPLVPSSESVCLAAVFDLCQARRTRELVSA